MLSATIEVLAYASAFLLGTIALLREIYPEKFTIITVVKKAKGSKPEETKTTNKRFYKPTVIGLVLLSFVSGCWNNTIKRGEQKGVDKLNGELKVSVDGLAAKVTNLKDSLAKCQKIVTTKFVNTGNLTGIELNNSSAGIVSGNQVTIVPFGESTPRPKHNKPFISAVEP
ncbi:MAG: hypothetical protein ACTHLE_04245 [Agriterribacter sp.]